MQFQISILHAVLNKGMREWAVTCPILVLLLAACGKQENPLTLIADGQSYCTIILPAEPTEEESLAAEELQTYLGKMTDAVVPIMAEHEASSGINIHVGATEAFRTDCAHLLSTLHHEGFLLKRRGKTVFIGGPSGLGTLYGVYDFLESWGVRWYIPDPLGEVVPEIPAMVLGQLDESAEPSYNFRWVGENEWSRRNKLNVNVPGRENIIGAKVWKSFHSFGDLMHPLEYYADHPEYFPVVDDVRQKRSTKGVLHGYTYGNQICTSNPELVKAIAVSMQQVLDEDPRIKVITLGPNDNMGYCEGRRCTALDEKDVPRDQLMSRRLLMFFTDASRIIKKSHPDRLVKFGAYHIYARPPDDPSILGIDNMMVMIAHYQDYSLSKPVNDPSSARNARYRSLIEGWKRKVDRLFFYEYYNKGNWYGLFWPIVHSIREDIPFLYNTYGAEGLYTQYSLGARWTLALNNYTAARLLWDVQADADMVLREFFTLFFEEAAVPMERFFITMEHAMIESDLDIPGNAQIWAPNIFTEEVMSVLEASIIEAKNLATSEIVRARVSRYEAVYDYMSRLLPIFRRWAQARESRIPEDLAAVKQEGLDFIKYTMQNRDYYDGVAPIQNALEDKTMIANLFRRISPN